ncbi:hypothetical protein [Parafrankia elaeagni]|uniref:hypothetical protein n=1 Tax=Parafrankia elaeagni TaxID=222534 RepID=UPI0003A3DD45|nr:hypothetical protein [Parafrankia elaeagni]
MIAVLVGMAAAFAMIALVVGVIGLVRGQVASLSIDDRPVAGLVTAVGFTIAVAAFGALAPDEERHDATIAAPPLGTATTVQPAPEPLGRSRADLATGLPRASARQFPDGSGGAADGSATVRTPLPDATTAPGGTAASQSTQSTQSTQRGQAGPGGGPALGTSAPGQSPGIGGPTPTSTPSDGGSGRPAAPGQASPGYRGARGSGTTPGPGGGPGSPGVGDAAPPGGASAPGNNGTGGTSGIDERGVDEGTEPPGPASPGPIPGSVPHPAPWCDDEGLGGIDVGLPDVRVRDVFPELTGQCG